jgi:hypothetical protein
LLSPRVVSVLFRCCLGIAFSGKEGDRSQPHAALSSSTSRTGWQTVDEEAINASLLDANRFLQK